MLTKDEWIENFEGNHGRKPLPKEFIEAKNNGEFEERHEESMDEPILETVDESPILDEENTSSTTAKENSIKIFCFNCGQSNLKESEFCSSCGTKLEGSVEQKSFFTDLSTKLSDFGMVASQKAKEFTRNSQLNSQIYKEKKNREELVKVLGNSYYQKYKDSADTDSDFKDLLTEIV
ncbi:TPA: zinc ribbon domain-containing protein, partial [Streptococcus equi subsp. zooepidemicus]|nr:zinc ribbon domain-containing protein [Streptococcus equi subsp. zooepidemicus]